MCIRDRITADEVLTEPGGYRAIADVTSLVRAGRDIWVADLVAGTGPNSFAGWSLIVVHAGDGTTRDIAVFDGLRSVREDAAVEIDTTMSTGGRVDGELVVVGFEGEPGLGSDGVSAGGQEFISARNPVDDLMNSTIANGDEIVAARSPAFVNTLGTDSDRLGFSGWDTGAAPLRFVTSGDRYLLAAVVVEVRV